LKLLRALANLKAEVHGVARPSWTSDLSSVANAAKKIELPAFVPRAGVQIETDPKAEKKQAVSSGDDGELIDQLLTKLEQYQSPIKQITVIEFEKDNDANFHMDVISGLANMRARNYGIPEVDKLQAKLIAGRIIPAIATTTAMATGLVGLELYMVICEKKLEDYRNTFANLALPLFAMAEPIPPKKFSFQEISWSLWDRWFIDEDVTVQGMLDWFSQKNLVAYSVTCGSSLIYNNIFPKHKERLGKKMSELVQTVAKLELPANRRHFDVVVACENEDGDDVDVPLLSIRFR